MYQLTQLQCLHLNRGQLFWLQNFVSDVETFEQIGLFADGFGILNSVLH
jgi:hypothetical protein